MSILVDLNDSVIADLRRLLNPGSTQRLSFPSTPVSNIQAPSQAGTPPTSVRSDSPATTPRSYPSQLPVTLHHQPSYHPPAHRVSTRSNLAVSVVKHSRSPSPSFTRSQGISAIHVVTNVPPPPSSTAQSGQGHNPAAAATVHSQPATYPQQQLEATCSSPQLEDHDSTEHPRSSFARPDPPPSIRRSHRLDASRHAASSGLQQHSGSSPSMPSGMLFCRRQQLWSPIAQHITGSS